jgi:hypothetical protein
VSYALRSSPGSLAMLAAMRRASSRVSRRYRGGSGAVAYFDVGGQCGVEFEPPRLQCFIDDTA